MKVYGRLLANVQVNNTSKALVWCENRSLALFVDRDSNLLLSTSKAFVAMEILKFLLCFAA